MAYIPSADINLTNIAVGGELSGSILTPVVTRLFNVAFGNLSVGVGGTGRTSFVQGGLLTGNGTSAISQITGSDGETLIWLDASGSWTPQKFGTISDIIFSLQENPLFELTSSIPALGVRDFNINYKQYGPGYFLASPISGVGGLEPRPILSSDLPNIFDSVSITNITSSGTHSGVFYGEFTGSFSGDGSLLTNISSESVAGLADLIQTFTNNITVVSAGANLNSILAENNSLILNLNDTLLGLNSVTTNDLIATNLFSNTINASVVSSSFAGDGSQLTNLKTSELDVRYIIINGQNVELGSEVSITASLPEVLTSVATDSNLTSSLDNGTINIGLQQAINIFSLGVQNIDSQVANIGSISASSIQSGFISGDGSGVYNIPVGGVTGLEEYISSISNVDGQNIVLDISGNISLANNLYINQYTASSGSVDALYSINATFQTASINNLSLTDLNVQTLTAQALIGNGAGITGINTQNIDNFLINVRNSFQAGTGLDITNGIISLLPTEQIINAVVGNKNINTTELNGIITVDLTDDVYLNNLSASGNVIATNLIGNGSLINGISASQIIGLNSSINDLVSQARIQDIGVGSNLIRTGSNEIPIILLKDTLNLTGSITASAFVGDGSSLTNLPLSGRATTASNIFTGNQTVNGFVSASTITASSGFFTGNVRIDGTASIGLLNTVSQSSLAIGDKYIIVMTGSDDHISLDGSGILYGSGSTGPTTSSLGSNASLLYSSPIDALVAYPRLSSSFSGNLYGTASYAETASYVASTNNAATASYAENANTLGGLSSSQFATTSSNQFNGTQAVTGAITASVGVSASVFYGDGSQLSGIQTTIDSSSFALTGSNTFIGNQVVSGTLNVTASISASTFYGDGSNLTGIQSPINTAIFATTGSNTFTGNQVVTGAISASNGFSGSLSGSVSGSYAGFTQLTASSISASYTGSISGSLATFNTITGSFISGSHTGSFSGALGQFLAITASNISGTHVTASSLTASNINTISITGSFKGNGSQLTNISASQITGLNTIASVFDVAFEGVGTLPTNSSLGKIKLPRAVVFSTIISGATSYGTSLEIQKNSVSQSLPFTGSINDVISVVTRGIYIDPYATLSGLLV